MMTRSVIHSLIGAGVMFAGSALAAQCPNPGLSLDSVVSEVAAGTAIDTVYRDLGWHKHPDVVKVTYWPALRSFRYWVYPRGGALGGLLFASGNHCLYRSLLAGGDLQAWAQALPAPPVADSTHLYEFGAALVSFLNPSGDETTVDSVIAIRGRGDRTTRVGIWATWMVSTVGVGTRPLSTVRVTLDLGVAGTISSISLAPADNCVLARCKW
jgi:hypothetical protein